MPWAPRLQWVGARYGRLVVIELDGKRGHKKMWRCLCDCGQTTVAQDSNLRSGHTQSCGCFSAERRPTIRLTHGATRTPEHDAWVNMRQRCYNEAVPHYADYGGRGIRVCDRWRDSFENFLADMGPRPSPAHSIDRIDNNGNYEPGNCRWRTRREQNSNRRMMPSNGAKIEFRGEMASVGVFAERYGLPPSTIYKRLQMGWSVERALTQKPNHAFASRTGGP